MRSAVHCLELVQAHARVDLRSLRARMAEHLLNETDVGAALEHQRCRRRSARPEVIVITCVHDCSSYLHLSFSSIESYRRAHSGLVNRSSRACFAHHET